MAQSHPGSGLIAAGSLRWVDGFAQENVMSAVPTWEPIDRLHSVTARPIRDDDADRVVRFFERLSTDTVYKRFFTAMPRLNPRMLRYLVDVDHDRRETLVALCRDEIIAMAGYDRVGDRPTVAEAAVVVEDGWQRHGVGRFLLRQLGFRARQAGIQTFEATVLSTNDGPVRLARSVAPLVELEFDGTQSYLRIPLAAATHPVFGAY
jgi:acetyltransferase